MMPGREAHARKCKKLSKNFNIATEKWMAKKRNINILNSLKSNVDSHSSNILDSTEEKSAKKHKRDLKYPLKLNQQCDETAEEHLNAQMKNSKKNSILLAILTGSYKTIPKWERFMYPQPLFNRSYYNTADLNKIVKGNVDEAIALFKTANFFKYKDMDIEGLMFYEHVLGYRISRVCVERLPDDKETNNDKHTTDNVGELKWLLPDERIVDNRILRVSVEKLNKSNIKENANVN